MFRSILAVVAGYLTMVIGVTTLFSFIMFVAFKGMPDVRDGFQPPGWLLWLEALSSPVIAAVGGYVCAWIARKREIRHALVLAAATVVLGAVSAAAEPAMKPLILVVAVPLLGAMGVLIGARIRIAHMQM